VISGIACTSATSTVVFDFTRRAGYSFSAVEGVSTSSELMDTGKQPHRSLHFSKLNSPSSPSLLLHDNCSNPLIILMACRVLGEGSSKGAQQQRQGPPGPATRAGAEHGHRQHRPSWGFVAPRLSRVRLSALPGVSMQVPAGYSLHVLSPHWSRGFGAGLGQNGHAGHDQPVAPYYRCLGCPRWDIALASPLLDMVLSAGGMAERG